jgi:parallel beta-helix repeat protein
MLEQSKIKRSLIAISAALVAGMCQPATANTLCVNSGGTGGCKSTINAAVIAAAPGDTIQVAHGTYKEDVVIPKSLSLIGENQENTIIDATGKANGIDIDGYGNPGLSDVVVSGFTVENANFAGILITNASYVTISDNEVVNNDKGLVTTGPADTCPGLPAYFQAGEGLDCGEGIQLSGVDHSILSGNDIEHNAGGILVADDTGPTHHNLITGNKVQHNAPFDCGITIPSHSALGGVFNNTVVGNDSSYNGGPGVGIFAPAPGRKAYGNVVVNNRLTNNGLPGVTMHNHAAPGVNGVPSTAPAVVFDDNLIVGNVISGNAPDSADAATAGPTGINIFSLAPMKGTVISGNIIDDEAIDIAIKIPGTAGQAPPVQIHLNNLGNNDKAIGVQDTGTAMVDATQNWWGCPGGPGDHGCATVNGTGVLFTPWLTKPIQGN